MTDHRIPPVRVIQLAATGARVLDGATGRSIGPVVRARFEQLLPQCGGNREVAAARALDATLRGGARRGGAR
jgi:hypothetical protein